MFIDLVSVPPLRPEKKSESLNPGMVQKNWGKEVS